MWGESYARSKMHSISILNDVIAEVDHAWGYYQDLTKRSEILSQKMNFYR